MPFHILSFNNSFHRKANSELGSPIHHKFHSFFFLSLFLLQVPIKRSTRSSPLLPFCLKWQLLQSILLSCLPLTIFLMRFSSSLYSFSKFQSKDPLRAPHYSLFCLKLQLLQSIQLFDSCPLLSASDHFLCVISTSRKV